MSPRPPFEPLRELAHRHLPDEQDKKKLLAGEERLLAAARRRRASSIRPLLLLAAALAALLVCTRLFLHPPGEQPVAVATGVPEPIGTAPAASAPHELVGGGPPKQEESTTADKHPHGRTGPEKTASTPVASAPSPGWAERAERRDLAALLAEADKSDFDQAMARATAADLLALGDAARDAGKQGLAARAYRTLRTRFAGGPQAAQAAFSLARMNESDPRQALGFCEQYLAESPGGANAAEAQGRAMLAAESLGEREKARQLAAQVLQQQPDGAYAARAARLVDPR